MRLLITLVAMTALSLSTPAAQKTDPDVFPKAKLNIQVGERTRQVEVTLKYEANALVLADRKTTLPLRTISYTAVRRVEYSYSKSPQWQSEIFASPPSRLTNGKKHWVFVQVGNDYLVVQLDNSNYKPALAAFERRTGKTVETVQEQP